MRNIFKFDTKIVQILMPRIVTTSLLIVSDNPPISPNLYTIYQYELHTLGSAELM